VGHVKRTEEAQPNIQGQGGPGGGKGRRDGGPTGPSAERYEVHPGQIQAWKKSLLEGAAGVFDGNQDKRQKSDAVLVARLYQQIGQLKVERSFRGRMDWYSRHVVAWRLSNTLDADFCVEALEDALGKGKPEVFNTDQGSQSTGEAFTGVLEQNNVRISPDEYGTFGMDGKGRYADNILLERLWRTVKYEEVYLKAYSSGREAKAGLDAYFHFYNNQRPHQALGYRTPAEAFSEDPAPSDERSINGKWAPRKALADLGKTAGLSLSFAPNLSN